jgi:hypothetical protein
VVARSLKIWKVISIKSWFKKCREPINLKWMVVKWAQPLTKWLLLEVRDWQINKQGKLGTKTLTFPKILKFQKMR